MCTLDPLIVCLVSSLLAWGASTARRGSRNSDTQAPEAAPHFSLSPLNSCHTGCFATVFKLFSFNNKLFVFCWFFIGNILINMLFKQGPISQTPANFMGPESCFMLSCCVCIQYQRPSVRTKQNFVCIAKNSVNSTITKIQRFCWEDLEAYYLLLTAIPHWLTLFLEHDQLKFF